MTSIAFVALITSVVIARFFFLHFYQVTKVHQAKIKKGPGSREQVEAHMEAERKTSIAATLCLVCVTIGLILLLFYQKIIAA